MTATKKTKLSIEQQRALGFIREMRALGVLAFKHGDLEVQFSPTPLEPTDDVRKQILQRALAELHGDQVEQVEQEAREQWERDQYRSA